MLLLEQLLDCSRLLLLMFYYPSKLKLLHSVQVMPCYARIELRLELGLGLMLDT